ncbi:MAG: D-glycero-beta-D-manno-heptose-7-phosphate kinase [Desulfomicrobium sp.]|nr:D-glycero-beta-D-manno-heptose-7-phosphate kinase [Pseudomonadota bacterium]MBV1712777.1 D-glycero-beta-D-manno-heptose-7-phosphate kinase [Desulfomicrobium sp.]MBU4571747.1 D-glycero-beta-D-manno-heptose-7-phosphate kinase [Pseudomonadota bacterium]MBU4595896.1 D-glycero-beta-D-manno-heptose-7-phosphate kinase [Pseudomonadota bacterium]MBV1721200.1 D-glycero-beta-D-manno-heptose-7-phosphate kinase [Desulfomicrobium sp.]
MNLAFNASRMIGSRVLIIGDIMLDQYQRGLVERISPEAPVPIVKITEQVFKIGGAGNVAQNVATLGGAPTLISICGEDLYGDNLRDICAGLRIDSHLIRSPSRETTLKTRIMAAHQQILRVDRETTRTLDNREFESLVATVDHQIENFSTIILSDYGKGIISEKFLRWLADRKRPDQKIILDPKTCNFPYYTNFYCMTPNKKEASEGAEMPISNREEILSVGREIIKRRNLQSLVITLGGEGMAVFLPGQGVFHLPTTAKKVFDVTGAGDTVIAVIALGLSSGLDLLSSCILANCAAGLVVGQVGAVGVTQEELTETLSSWPSAQQEKWSTL